MTTNTVNTNTLSIFKLSMPMLMSMVLEQIIGLTDVIFLGRVSEVSVGAATIGGIGFFVFTMIAMGYGIAAQSQMGIANGSKDYSLIGKIFVQSLYFFTAFLALLAVVLPFVIPYLFEIGIQSPNVRAEAYSYFVWRMVGIGFAFICIAFRGFFMAILQPAVLTYSSFVMVASNCVLNYLLIFGIGPFPALGIAGAAIASTLAEFLAVIFFVAYALYKKCHQKYGLFHCAKPDKELQILLFKLGRYMMMQETVLMTSWLLFFVWVEHMGERALAVSNIVRSVSNLMFIIVHAFGLTCGSIGANLLGENRATEVDSMMKRGLKLSFVITIPLAFLIAVYPEPLLVLFTDIPSLRMDSVDSLRVMLSAYLLCVPAYHYFLAFGFLGATRESMIISFISIFAYTTYCYLITNWAEQVATVWTADWFYYVITSICVLYFWKRLSWRSIYIKKA